MIINYKEILIYVGTNPFNLNSISTEIKNNINKIFRVNPVTGLSYQVWAPSAGVVQFSSLNCGEVYAIESDSVGYELSNNLVSHDTNLCYDIIVTPTVTPTVTATATQTVTPTSTTTPTNSVTPTSTTTYGTLWATGDNAIGQLGFNNTDIYTTFTQVGILDSNRGSSGNAFSAIIKSDNTLWVVGQNHNGQLGLGNNTNRLVFTYVGNNWNEVSCGDYHFMLALANDGTLWSTGYNAYGQLGLGDNNNRNILTQVGTNTNWINIFTGTGSSFAIRNDGTLWACGWNVNGQLGLNDIVSRTSFTQVGSDTNWSKVSSSRGGSNNFTYAIKNDNTLWATGNASFNQLSGIPINNHLKSFTQIGTDNDWNSVSCGDSHTFAIKNNGTLWAVGYNHVGQLGLGDTVARSVFTQVGSDNNWLKVKCGEAHSVALKNDGTLWVSGNNSYGRLGLGSSSSTSVYTFTQIGTDNNWKNIFGGNYMTYAIK